MPGASVLIVILPGCQAAWPKEWLSSWRGSHMLSLPGPVPALAGHVVMSPSPWLNFLPCWQCCKQCSAIGFQTCMKTPVWNAHQRNKKGAKLSICKVDLLRPRCSNAKMAKRSKTKRQDKARTTHRLKCKQQQCWAPQGYPKWYAALSWQRWPRFHSWAKCFGTPTI